MSSSNTRSNRKNRRGKRRDNVNMVSAIVRASSISNPEPPQFDSSIHFVQRFRFVLTAAVQNYQINPIDITSLLLVSGFVGTDADTPAYGIITRFKYKAIEMWTTTSSLALPASISVAFVDLSGIASNTEKTQSDTTASIDRYAYVKLRPRNGSLASEWQNPTSTAGSFVFSAPQGTILDLTLHCYLQNNDAVQLVTVFSANPALQVGSLFQNFLDSNPVALGLLTPVGYINLTPSTVPTPRP